MYGLTSAPQCLQTTLRSTSATSSKIAGSAAAEPQARLSIRPSRCRPSRCRLIRSRSSRRTRSVSGRLGLGRCSSRWSASRRAGVSSRPAGLARRRRPLSRPPCPGPGGFRPGSTTRSVPGLSRSTVSVADSPGWMFSVLGLAARAPRPRARATASPSFVTSKLDRPGPARSSGWPDRARTRSRSRRPSRRLRRSPSLVPGRCRSFFSSSPPHAGHDQQREPQPVRAQRVSSMTVPPWFLRNHGARPGGPAPARCRRRRPPRASRYPPRVASASSPRPRCASPRSRSPRPGARRRCRSGTRVDVVVGDVERAGDVRRRPTRPLAHVEDLELGSSCVSVRKLLDADPLHAPDVAVLRPPARHAARRGSRRGCGRRSPPPASPPGGRPRRRGRSARPPGRGSATQASLVPKPALSIVMQTEPGNVRLVELEVGAHVHQQRALGPLLLELARRQRHHLDARGQQRAAVEVDDGLEVGRLRRQLRGRALDEALLVRLGEQLVVAQLVADRGGRPSGPCPGPPHSDPPRCPGQTSVSGGSANSLSCRLRKIPLRPLLPVDRQVGARDVADEQRVAGQHRPRLVAAAVSISANAVCSGRWPGVWMARTRSEPSSSSQPSSNGSCGTRPAQSRGCGSSRRSPPRAGRGRRRGRRGCGSRARARSARPM